MRSRVLAPLGLCAAVCVLTASCSSGGRAAPSTTTPSGRRSALAATTTLPSKKTTGVTSSLPSATPAQRQLCLALATGLRGYSSAAGAGRTPAALKSAFAQLKVEEPKVLAVAPAKVHGAFVVLFGFLNQFYSALSATGFDYARLPAAEASKLSKDSTQIAAATTTIQSYLANTCRTSIVTLGGNSKRSGVPASGS